MKPKDDFKEKHPNYRNFVVPPLAPLTELPKKEPVPKKDYRKILAEYEEIHGRPFPPVRYRAGSPQAPDLVVCPSCNAPHQYLYYNDGKKKSQLLCKVCGKLFQAGRRFSRKTKYWCPYCLHALFTWKHKKEVTHYKCCNDHCEYRIRQINKRNQKEQDLAKKKSSQFKVSYQYREYRYHPHDLAPSGPQQPILNLNRVYNGPNVLGLILAFYVSFALSARKVDEMFQQLESKTLTSDDVFTFKYDTSINANVLLSAIWKATKKRSK